MLVSKQGEERVKQQRYCRRFFPFSLERHMYVLMHWQCFQVLLVIKNSVATKLSIKNIKKSTEATRHTEDDKTVFDPCYRFYVGSSLNTRTVLQLDVPLQPLCKD